MRGRRFLIVSVLLVAAACGRNVNMDPTDLMSDTWVATDALGRQMPLVDSVGKVKTGQERAVGIFYITWHGKGNHDLPGESPRWAISSARTSG